MARRAKLNTKPLVDEFAKVKALKNETEKQYNDLRARILALGMTICDGTDCKVVLLERNRTSLDTETLKADYGSEWYMSYCRETSYYELEVIRNG